MGGAAGSGSSFIGVGAIGSCTSGAGGCCLGGTGPSGVTREGGSGLISGSSTGGGWSGFIGRGGMGPMVEIRGSGFVSAGGGVGGVGSGGGDSVAHGSAAASSSAGGFSAPSASDEAYAKYGWLSSGSHWPERRWNMEASRPTDPCRTASASSWIEVYICSVPEGRRIRYMPETTLSPLSPRRSFR